MANVKVRVLNAVVDGNGEGSVIELNVDSAKHLVSLGYVEILAEEKVATKTESAPKAEPKPAQKKSKSKDDK